MIWIIILIVILYIVSYTIYRYFKNTNDKTDITLWILTIIIMSIYIIWLNNDLDTANNLSKSNQAMFNSCVDSLNWYTKILHKSTN